MFLKTVLLTELILKTDVPTQDPNLHVICTNRSTPPPPLDGEEALSEPGSKSHIVIMTLSSSSLCQRE